MSSLIFDDQKINDIKLVVFDKDGTLIDIHHYWGSMLRLRSTFLVEKYIYESKEEIIEELLDSMGIDTKRNKIKSEGPVGIKPRKVIIESAFKVLKKYVSRLSEDDVSKVFKEVDRKSIEKLTDFVRPLPGALNFLNKLKENGIKSSLATTDLTERAKLAMSALNAQEYFDVIAGADLVENTKPAPDLVELISKQTKIPVENTLVVGDSMPDLNMAKNANCIFLGVKTGLYNSEFIQKCDFLTNDLESIEVNS